MKKNALVVAFIVEALLAVACVQPEVIHEGVVKSVEARETGGTWLAAGSRYDVVTFEDGFVVKVYGLQSYKIGARYRVMWSTWGHPRLEKVGDN